MFFFVGVFVKVKCQENEKFVKECLQEVYVKEKYNKCLLKIAKKERNMWDKSLKVFVYLKVAFKTLKL